MRTAILLALAAMVVAGDVAPADLPKLTLKPKQFSVTKQVNFDDAGKPTSEQRCQLEISFTSDRKLLESERMSMLSSREEVVHLDEAVTDSGESLLGDKASGHLWNQGFRGKSSWSLSLTLKSPTKPCLTLTKLSGTLQLQVADGEPLKISLNPLSQFLGKPVALQGLPGVEITIERTAKQLVIEGPNAAFTGEITFTNADGSAVENNSTSSNGNGKRTTATYHTNVPTDGAVIFTMQQNIRKVQVPFTLIDLPLTGPEAAPEPKMPRKFKRIPGPLPPETPVETPTTPPKKTDF
ncbi:MAG: hypothetical protein AAB263_13685 [Planctomycetota bacterium]